MPSAITAITLFVTAGNSSLIVKSLYFSKLNILVLFGNTLIKDRINANTTDIKNAEMNDFSAFLCSLFPINEDILFCIPIPIPKSEKDKKDNAADKVAHNPKRSIPTALIIKGTLINDVKTFTP